MNLCYLCVYASVCVPTSARPSQSSLPPSHSNPMGYARVLVSSLSTCLRVQPSPDCQRCIHPLSCPCAGMCSCVLVYYVVHTNNYAYVCASCMCVHVYWFVLSTSPTVSISSRLMAGGTMVRFHSLNFPFKLTEMMKCPFLMLSL